MAVKLLFKCQQHILFSALGSHAGVRAVGVCGLLRVHTSTIHYFIRINEERKTLFLKNWKSGHEVMILQSSTVEHGWNRAFLVSKHLGCMSWPIVFYSRLQETPKRLAVSADAGQ